MKVLITGGAGFIGSNLVHHLHAVLPTASIVTLDALTYAGNLENLSALEESPRHRFVRGDITDATLVDGLVSGGMDVIVHLAAESHVDRSIEDPSAVVRTNVLGTQVLLDAARRHGVGRFVQVSTDEVYGSLGAEGMFREDSPLQPTSPYAASKAAADLLVQAAVRTYGFPGIVTRCSNNYGPFQFPEKIIPLFITNALDDQPLPLYGDGMHVRDWIHVRDHCRALQAVIERGRVGEVYNVGAGAELNNRTLTGSILQQLGKPETLIRFVTDRPGHDRRYAIDAAKLRGELGWSPEATPAEGLAETIRWYQEHRGWWEAVKNGAYRTYYDRMYGARLNATGSTRGGSPSGAGGKES
jgi:dTDP-glucose 4,6-dehydratase